MSEAEKKTDIKEYKIDEKDKNILNILQQNYRISYQKLSEMVGLAASTIHNRVQNMIESGIIRNFDTVVCPLKVGYKSVAILGLSVNHGKIRDAAQKLATYNEIQLVATSTGDHDIILQVYAQDEKALWRFIKNKVKTIDGVQPQVHVSSFLDIIKMSHKIVFED